jgi:type I restriction enzyme, R subunit
LAVIEAKDNTHSVGDGIQQALAYATTLDIPFVFSWNGNGSIFQHRTVTGITIETDIALDAFPAPAALWACYRAWKGRDAAAEQVVLQDYYNDGLGRRPATTAASAEVRELVKLLVFPVIVSKITQSNQ